MAASVAMASATKCLAEGRTAPPVRLRMTCSDMLCIRSMEVEWEDGTGVRRSWSSWTDQEVPSAGWLEAERLLPSSATDINVQFKVRGPGGPWAVCRVDRQRNCSWVTKDGEHIPESIWLRTGLKGGADQEIDAVFDLTGPMQACYAFRAWNAARAADSQTEAWEHWEDEATRPVPEPRGPILEAADAAAPLAVGLGKPQVYCICTTKRVCAALHALMGVHRQTLQGLKDLDDKFTGQWLGVNVGNTASAGLGIASAVLLFAAPPLGVGLGIGSAVAGGAAFAGDSLADWAHLGDLKRQLCKDAWNTFVATELLKEWVQAREALLRFPSEGVGSPDDPFCDSRYQDRDRSSSSIDGYPVIVAAAVDGGLTVSAVVDGAASAGTHIAEQLGSAAAVASQVLGITGALISTGFAIRGWSTSKAGQSAVREKMAALRARLLQIQQLLASVDRLECPLCADDVILSDIVSRCSHGCHCFHAACVRRYQHAGGSVPSRATILGAKREDLCPECGGPLEAETEMLVETLANRQRKLRREGRCLQDAVTGDVTGDVSSTAASRGGCRIAQEALMAPITGQVGGSGRRRGLRDCL